MVIKDQSPEVKLISKFIIELNIARKNVLTYPESHPLIKASVDKTFELLKKLLAEKNELAIGIVKDALLVGEDYLDKKSIVFKNFALALNKKAIASVTFSAPLNKEDFIKFHGLISSEQKTDETFEDIVSAVNKIELENIKIKMLDYRAFRLIQERRLSVQQKTDKLWDTFIRAFLENLLDIVDYDEVEDLSETLWVSPASVAEELNQKSAEDISQALCDKTVAGFLNQMGDSAEERKMALGKLTELISNLKPEIRELFLASVIKHVSEKPDSADNILSEFPDVLIKDVIEILSAKDTMVPTTVLSLLQKLLDTGREAAVSETHIERETLGDLTEDEIKKLLRTVSEENFTPSDYGETLTDLISSTNASEIRASAAELYGTVDQDNIEEEMANVIFEILERDISDEEFLKLIGKLREMSVFFLETGQFNVLTKTYDALVSHVKSDNEMRAKASDEAIQFFSEQRFMEDVINGFNQWGKEKYEDISILIKKIGVVFIPLLLDTIPKEKDSIKKDFLVKLAAAFEAAATFKAIKSVEDADPYLIRKLIIILRQSDDRNVVFVIRRFIKHPDPSVQFEVLKTLLHFRAPDISTPLREAMSSKNKETAQAAIFLAGMYKVSDVKDLLLTFLKKKIFWGSNLENKSACVRALGEIGDPAVLTNLSKAYKAKSIFNRKALTKLKKSIIRSMEKYPRDEAISFLKSHTYSNRSKDNNLQKACTEMLDNIMNKKAI